MAFFRRSTKQQPFPENQVEELPPNVAEIVATQDFSFFTPTEWRRFTDAVRGSLERGVIPDAQYGGQGYIESPSIGYIFLDNISRFCHDEPQHEWDRMVDEFFASVAAPRKMIGTLEELRVRLVPHRMDDDTIGHEWAPTIRQELCFDFPTAIVGATSNDLERLQLGVDDALAVAWRQTLSTNRPEASQVFTIGDEPKQTLFDYQFGESFFVSCLVQDLPQFAGDLGPAGALFGVPSRTGFCVHRLGVDAPLDLALPAILQFIRSTFDDAIRQVSGDLFWWKDGRVTWLPTITNDQGFPVLNPNVEAVRTFNHHLGR